MKQYLFSKLMNASFARKFLIVSTVQFFLLFVVQAVYAKHPILQHDIDYSKKAIYESNATTIMSMTDEEMLSFLPEWSYVRACECPKCYGGAQGYNVFDWCIKNPNQMKCRYCGTVFPNEQYQEDQHIEGRNERGELITFPYHFNAVKKKRHFLSTHLLFYKRQWLEGQCVALGKAYLATGKGDYARRVALVLDKLAQRYPHYPVMHNNRPDLKFRASQKFPFDWDSGKWGNFHDEIPRYLVWAYDMVHDSDEFEKLSRIRGYSVHEKIRKDFFEPAFRAVEASKFHVGNVVGYDVTSAAILGRVLGEPSYVHRAYSWMLQNVNEGYFYDGMWKEGSASYHYMTMGGLQSALNSVKGYTDLPGYKDPIDGKRYDNLNTEENLPIISSLSRVPSKMDWPTGISSCFHDTHPYEKRSEPRNETFSAILPGVGHAALGCGKGPHQIKAQLHFSGAYGHAHSDNLTISLFAKGAEMLPDLGYTVTQMSYWTNCSLGHNLTVVDRKDQIKGASDGDLLWYYPDVKGVSVVEADGKRGYSNIKTLDQYRRMLIMIPASPQNAYVVDIFRIRGGQMHDWTVNGDADQETEAACSFPLGGKKKWMLDDGEVWNEPMFEGHSFNPYGMIRDVAHGSSTGPFYINYQYKDANPKGIRIHFTGKEETEVWLGKSPSVRRAGKDMRKAWDYWMPKLVVRKKGKAPLQSTFAVVEEPYGDKPFIDKVEQIALTPQDGQAVAIRIKYGNTVDTVISTLDDLPYPERKTPDGIRFQGRLGILRQVAGKVAGIWLFEAQKLSYRDVSAKQPVSWYEGTIVSATRKVDGNDHNAFVTKTDLPSGKTLHDTWMIVTHGNGYMHGYEIDYIENRGEETVIILKNDHGLIIKDNITKELFFPLRSIDGANRFDIPIASHFFK